MASWPPAGVADRPRAARIAGAGHEGVVAALAVGHADRVDGREVEDVEAELGQLRELLLHAAEAAPRAREELIPRAEAREHAVDVDLQRPGQLGHLRARGVALDDRRQAGIEPGGDVAAVLERSGHALHGRAVGAAGVAGRLAQQQRALERLAGQVGLAGLDLARHLVAPAGEHGDPRLDRPLPGTGGVDRELTRPAHALMMGVDRGHRRLGEAPVARPPVAHDRPQGLVSVAEDVGRDRDGVADRALHRPAPALDRRGDELDADSRRRRLGSGQGWHAAVPLSDFLGS